MSKVSDIVIKFKIKKSLIDIQSKAKFTKKKIK